MNMKGFWGKFLLIDLSTKEITVEKRDSKFYRQYYGGTGLGVRYLYDNMASDVDPLGPDNILGVIPGLFNGMSIPFGGRWEVVAKLPLTHTWGNANCGGTFGDRFKKTGWDAIFVKGISEKPVYIYIEDNNVEIRDASHLWGKSAGTAEDILHDEMGTRIGVASIGVPGEKQSLISCIMNDHSRAAARCGLGAVMGSKKLKAIAVNGTQKVPVADLEAFTQAKKKYGADFKGITPSKTVGFFMKLSGPMLPALLKSGKISGGAPMGTMLDMFKDMGTTMSIAAEAQMGDSPVKNWGGVGCVDFPMRTKSNKISDEVYKPYHVKKYFCSSCPLGCGAVMDVPGIGKTHRPEYETVAAFGSNLLNDDLLTVLKCNEICNNQGFDTISAGSVIAFAIECYEKGLITKEETGGIELTWGNKEAIVQVLEAMVKREGIGEVLADGSKYAAERIGQNSHNFAIHVGGQDLAMHDSRLNSGFGTGYLTDPAPGRHTCGSTGYAETGTNLLYPEGRKLEKINRQQYKGKGEHQKMFSNWMQLLDSVGICGFAGWTGMTYPVSTMINSITGWDVTADEVNETAERIQNVRQAFNARLGISYKKFKLPDRAVGNPPLKTGPTANVTLDIETMAKEFYHANDWDVETGKPSIVKLQELDLHDLIDSLHNK